MRVPMRIPIICLAVLLPAQLLLGDELVRGTQEELRRRNLYFGDIDGRESHELSEALKRYQARKGFASTGTANKETARSLGLVPREPGEAPPTPMTWPEEPVLKSDEHLNVQSEAVHLAASTGVASASLLGSVRESAAPARRASGRRNAALASNQAGAVAPAGGSRPGHRGALPPQRLDPANLHPLVAGYFHSVSGHRFEEELHFYADRVNYFNAGPIDRRIIESSLHKYYHRWPTHDYALAGPVRYERIPARAQVAVTCPVRFTLKRGSTVVKGTTLTRLVFDAATADPRIVSIQERRLQGG